MTPQEIGSAQHRAASALRRRPDLAIHEDLSATVLWLGGLQMAATHPEGTEILTDMHPQVGGEGEQVTPGWLLRAGLAACTATTIAMAAARASIELDSLEIRASSQSDMRALMGVADDDVLHGYTNVRLEIRLGATGVTDERLRQLVDEGCRCSPVMSALRGAASVAVEIEIEAR